MDSFTNFLLVTLIGLISYIGAKAYDKMNQLFDMIKSIMMVDVSRGKDIEQLQTDIEDHEKRIRDIEEKI